MTDAVVRPLRRDARENAARILLSARELLSERGPEGLTVSEVAHRAGVNRTTAYQHFRTRDELVGAVLAEIGHEITGLLQEPRPIGALIDSMLDFYVDQPEIARLWMYWLLADAPLESREVWNEFLARLQNLVDSPMGEDGVDAEMLGHILVSAFFVWSIRVRQEAENETEVREATRRYARELKRLLLHGVLRAERWPELAEAISESSNRENDAHGK